jgi:hypothetical protein
MWFEAYTFFKKVLGEIFELKFDNALNICQSFLRNKSEIKEMTLYT